jgi:hypothetical protein
MKLHEELKTTLAIIESNYSWWSNVLVPSYKVGMMFGEIVLGTLARSHLMEKGIYSIL